MPDYVVYGTSSASTVGSKYSNRLGLYDMIGNVWEMLTDWYNAWPGGALTDPYCEVQNRSYVTSVEGVGDAIPYITPITLYRAGGCFVDNENLTAPYDENLRVYATYANYFYAPDHDIYTGFRLCRNVTATSN